MLHYLYTVLFLDLVFKDRHSNYPNHIRTSASYPGEKQQGLGMAGEGLC